MAAPQSVAVQVEATVKEVLLEEVQVEAKEEDLVEEKTERDIIRVLTFMRW